MFNPERPFFRDIHRLLKRHLRTDTAIRFLEVGCYPGTYLWYFNKYFGYHVEGIEYLEDCARRCAEHMRELKTPATVRHGDLFSETGQWDVVCSVGLVEHFNDVRAVIDRHLDLVRSGGWLVLIIPNHAGINGAVLKMIDRKKYDIHNHMAYETMEAAVSESGRAEIIEGGYYGRIGFWSSGLYEKVKPMGKLLYFLVRAALDVIERAAQYVMPNTKLFAPHCALIARKK